jgi:hypothetical protein
MNKRDGSHDQMNPPYTQKNDEDDDGIMILRSWKASCVEELHTHKR